MKIFDPKITPGPWNETLIYEALRHLWKHSYSFLNDDIGTLLENSGGGNLPNYTSDPKAIAAIPELLKLLKLGRAIRDASSPMLEAELIIDLHHLVDEIDEKHGTEVVG